MHRRQQGVDDELGEVIADVREEEKVEVEIDLEELRIATDKELFHFRSVWGQQAAR